MIELDRDTNKFEVSCDNCPEATCIDTDGDWEAMIVELKDAGWSSEEDDEGWCDQLCAACSKVQP